MSFFQKLNFASSNEDGLSELAALAAARRIVCLTGSGTRPLDLLMSEADEIIALDMNPMQNALLALKMAAIRMLDHEAYLQFVGVSPALDRAETYARLRPSLAPEVATIWDRNLKLIRKGVWYGGLWEKVLRFGALGVRLVRGRSIEWLFATADPVEQAHIWSKKFDDRLWRMSIRLLGRRWVWSKVIGEPGGEFLPTADAVEARLAGAFRKASQTFLFRDSDFASLILRGKHVPEEALPVHMEARNYEMIKQRLGRLRIVHGGLTDMAENGIIGIDGFSLSDFGSYCDAAAYAACWNGVLEAASPGALFCERIFMNDLALPSGRISVDRPLSDKLTRHDRAIIYEIRAGSLGASLS